jgi:hypothetical protein
MPRSRPRGGLPEGVLLAACLGPLTAIAYAQWARAAPPPPPGAARRVHAATAAWLAACAALPWALARLRSRRAKDVVLGAYRVLSLFALVDDVAVSPHLGATPGHGWAGAARDAARVLLGARRGAGVVGGSASLGLPAVALGACGAARLAHRPCCARHRPSTPPHPPPSLPSLPCPPVSKTLRLLITGVGAPIASLWLHLLVQALCMAHVMRKLPDTCAGPVRREGDSKPRGGARRGAQRPPASVRRPAPCGARPHLRPPAALAPLCSC